NAILIAVNLDPHNGHGCDFEIPLWEFGLPDSGSLQAEDLLAGGSFWWHGKIQHLWLDPTANPAAVWPIPPPGRAPRARGPGTIMTPETGAAGKAYVPQDPQGAVMRRKSPQGGADRTGPEDKSTTTRQTSAAEVIDRSDRLWFKRAIIYEAHVKAFFDAND